jgi:hypothetical protein
LKNLFVHLRLRSSLRVTECINDDVRNHEKKRVAIRLKCALAAYL